jgi:magnesium chelatase subunit D
MGQLPPLEESKQVACSIAEDHVHSVVINMEHAAFDQGLAQTLADHLDAPCYTITELKAENLYMAVRQEMRQVNAGAAASF